MFLVWVELHGKWIFQFVEVLGSKQKKFCSVLEQKKAELFFGLFETFSIYSKHFIQISTPYNVIESRVYFKESNFAGRNQTSQWIYGNRPFES